LISTPAATHNGQVRLSVRKKRGERDMANEAGHKRPLEIFESMMWNCPGLEIVLPSSPA